MTSKNGRARWPHMCQQHVCDSELLCEFLRANSTVAIVQYVSIFGRTRASHVCQQHVCDSELLCAFLRAYSTLAIEQHVSIFDRTRASHVCQQHVCDSDAYVPTARVRERALAQCALRAKSTLRWYGTCQYLVELARRICANGTFAMTSSCSICVFTERSCAMPY